MSCNIMTMSSSKFVYIDNPVTEKSVLQRYVNLQNMLRDRNRKERLNDYNILEKNEKLFAPIIKSTDRIGSQIYNNMKNNNDHDSDTMNDDNENKEDIYDISYPPPQMEDEKVNVKVNGYYKQFFSFPENQIFPKPEDIDKDFGINKSRNEYLFAGKVVHIKNNDDIEIPSLNIEIKNISSGTWNLIMLKQPSSLVYDNNDIDQYGKILKEIGMKSYIESLPTSKSQRMLKSKKMVEIIKPIIGDILPSQKTKKSKNSKNVHLLSTPSPMRTRSVKKEGLGLIYTTIKPGNRFKIQRRIQKGEPAQYSNHIEYLPSDIKSLHDQLSYLLAEYKSGNLSLRNKIVSILKNLRSRKAITPSEYKIRLNSIDE